MSGAQSISTRRAYGVQRVCRVWHRARSSVYARRQATRSPAPCRRRGPIGAAPDDVLVAHIRRVLEASPFHGEGYRKAWAKLRVDGIRTSQERVRRLMRESGLQAPSAGTASRRWSRFARASGNASGASATAWPAGCVSGTTTGRTIWPTISNRRSRSSASKALRASCGSPKATVSLSALFAR